ncbi:MAG: hypothetical protein BWY46_00022 [Firmicutes bacterium ADurb.Bin300]|nr:MAG: hypothetical protein BWY46_00022 [Firmicutes bacterium ADurb.Bin300]
MKTTFLVYKDIHAENKELRVATHDEWDAIMKANKGLPTENRRRFIRDCITDSMQTDCMFIEVSPDEYRKWHAEHDKSERIRKTNSEYQTLSFDAPVEGADIDTLGECVPDGIDIEQISEDIMFLENLREKLRQWRPWANEMLDYYLSDNKVYCTQIIMSKYGITRRMVAKRKAAFVEKIKEIMKNNEE